MDKEMLQKVLDFIREGAASASGPAKWGFEQVCAYRASREMAWLVGLGAVFSLLLVALLAGLKRVARDDLDPDNVPADTAGLAAAFLGGLGILICLFVFLATFSESYATIHNPAGSVLSGLTQR